MKYLICNFKNKLLKEDIIKYTEGIKDGKGHKTRLVLCPPMLYLPYFKDVTLGAQDISSFMDETITGEVDGAQLRSMGVDYVIVGHSERRRYKKEINIDFINKINNALSNGIKVVYCIGETLSEKEAGDTFVVLEKQISEVLNNVELKDIIVAYEPVWAIGTGVTPSIKDIKEVVIFLKDLIMENYETKLDILYGGSVSDSNIEELLTIKGLDGFLVGGASLDYKKVQNMISKMEE